MAAASLIGAVGIISSFDLQYDRRIQPHGPDVLLAGLEDAVSYYLSGRMIVIMSGAYQVLDKTITASIIVIRS